MALELVSLWTSDILLAIEVAYLFPCSMPFEVRCVGSEHGLEAFIFGDGLCASGNVDISMLNIYLNRQKYTGASDRPKKQRITVKMNMYAC